MNIAVTLQAMAARLLSTTGEAVFDFLKEGCMAIALLGEVNPGPAVMERDALAANLLGLSPDSLAELQQRHVQSLGNVSVGTLTERPVFRAHWGASEEDITNPAVMIIAKGGIKYTDKYPTTEAGVRDVARHGRDMSIKTGVIGLPTYVGGKAWAALPTRLYQEDPDAAAESMRQLARLMREAGYAHPRVDVPAGDEGTNLLIEKYIEGLDGLVDHPYATITGKADMPARPTATGYGAAYAMQMSMERAGIDATTVAVQGFGLAGANFVLRANELRRQGDGPVIYTQAIGDMQKTAGGRLVPVTLFTDHPEGLPVDREMVEAVLYDPNDKDVRSTDSRPAALAAKIARQYPDVNLQLKNKDVLTFDAAQLLVPSATSNVVTPEIAKLLRSDQMIYPIANNAYCAGVLDYLRGQGIRAGSSAVISAGGVYMSIGEHRGDLDRVEKGDPTLPREPVEKLDDDLKATMRNAIKTVETVADHYGVDHETATTIVGLGKHALHRDMAVDKEAKSLLSA